MERKYTAVIQKRGQWYVAYVEELPGVNAQGKTKREARRNLEDAVALVSEVNRGFAARAKRRTTPRKTKRRI